MHLVHRYRCALRSAKKMRFIRLYLIALVSIMSSCATIPDSDPGINQKEMKALTSSYYWKEELSTPKYTKQSLAELMDRSVEPDLDGEKAEGYSSALILALAESGDDLFASVLTTRTRIVQSSIRPFISTAWTWSKLEYPITRAILQSNP